jgi:light-regulated signal transduction histidine kinase (bacteriophytochrome)
MIRIYTQLLIREVQDRIDEKALGYADVISQGVARMQILLHDLLGYARATYKDENSEHESAPADLNSVLEQVLGLLAEPIEASNASVTSDRLPKVLADESQLVHVLKNLIENSIKYRGLDPPRVHVTAERHDEYWTIRLEDNGIGFDQQYAEQIFGLFRRLHRSEYNGTGLGLAICKRIVERGGGRIWAEGRLGKGSVFFLTLPAI